MLKSFSKTSPENSGGAENSAEISGTNGINFFCYMYESSLRHPVRVPEINITACNSAGLLGCFIEHISCKEIVKLPGQIFPIHLQLIKVMLYCLFRLAHIPVKLVKSRTSPNVRILVKPAPRYRTHTHRGTSSTGRERCLSATSHCVFIKQINPPPPRR